MNKLLKYLIIAALLVVAGMIFYNKVYLPKTTYSSISPKSGNLDVKIFGIGNVGAKNIYAINAQTGGKILSINTDQGEWVKKGDLLVTLDSVDLPQLLAEAKIGVKKASLEVEATKKELLSLESQKALAQITYERYSKLKKLSFASQSEYDKAKADLDIIDAQIEASKARIESAKAEITRAQKSVKALQVKLSRYKVYSPADGYVISKDAEVAQSVLPSQKILQVVDTKGVWIKAYIDEKISGDVKVGQKATIVLRSQKQNTYTGVVKRIVAQSDAITGEREVDVAFDNLPIPFYINEQAEVNIAIEHLQDVLKIPASSLIYSNGVSGVWLKNNDKAKFQKVDVLARGENEIAISGISKESKILIVTPKNKPLRDGMSIH